MKKSMTETAYDILSKSEGPQSFIELWSSVVKDMGLTPAQADNQIAQFYTDLSIDGRFFSLAGNRWDLKSRYSSAESNVDTDSLTVEDDEDEEEDEKEDQGEE